MLGGLSDRAHDLVLCGVDPSHMDLRECLSALRDQDEARHGEMSQLIRMASRHWRPSLHAYMYGPEFQACISAVCHVKVLAWCILIDVILALSSFFLFSLLVSHVWLLILYVCMHM